MKTISKLNKNKKQLHDMSISDEEVIVEDTKLDIKTTKRRFVCDCGCEVTLEGFVDTKRTKCSECLKK
jgi:hypothetical protein